MATWKKLVVSGSDISQLNNDAGYLTSVTAQTAFVTASFNGVHLIANNSEGQLNFASSSGQGLTISANAGTDTLTFGLAAIPNTSLANSTFNVGAGNGLTGGGSANLGGTSTVNVGAGTHITVNTDDIAVNESTLITAISGSIFSQVSGDVTIASNGVATIAANSVALGTDTTGDYVANLGTGTGVTIASNTGEGSAPTIAVNYGSTANTAVQGNTTISLTGTANEVQITGTTAQALGGAPSYTIGLPDNVTITTDLTVGGNLYVNGTTTQVNTAELFVEDKFIILASGSASAGDGGIIIDRGSDAAGNIAFGYDSATDRWGYQNGLTDTTNAITIGTDGDSAFAGYVFTEAAHTSAPTSGEFVAAGAIYTATSGDIFIYS
ncbi:structural protein [Flavobacterium phage vB_FspM_immuto_2-6A]|uniref:Structural protein n=1 Tax=Flavobacterium phage vB_FspM_immuto_2-6A TaxID=2801477 RepID=A0A7T8ERR0_9CAUD|nr:virion structural protein [Flavobacterium phage vB_FspM_immuto_2-6A]QQO91895.1 structural protein [Flavobacterium phage vB_FspM_immuto_2-6A]QQO92371.1 structural protein [Flavobacterium phage vB_FspM_immuto_13-6C]